MLDIEGVVIKLTLGDVPPDGCCVAEETEGEPNKLFGLLHCTLKPVSKYVDRLPNLFFHNHFLVYTKPVGCSVSYVGNC